MSAKFEKLLVLDVDETLIYATMFSLPHPADFEIGLAHAWKRPGVERFLATCFKWFQVGIWTSATKPYVADVIWHLTGGPSQFAFVLDREKCFRTEAVSSPPISGGQHPAPDPRHSTQRQIWVKDLKLLLSCGYRAEAIIVVDDSPESWVGHQDNVVAVSKYRGDPADRELSRVLRLLEKLGSLEDVRPASKVLR